MAPNLVVAIRKALNPLSWMPALRDGNNHQYHYQLEPVPGIYYIDSEYRWLVAIKPSGRKDVHNILAPRRHIQTNQESEYPNKQSETRNSSTMTWDSTSLRCSSASSLSYATDKRDAMPSTTKYKTLKVHFSWFQNIPGCGLLAPWRLPKKPNHQFNRLTREDCFGGFRHLVKPLRTEYNNVLKRWIFSAEIKERTTRIKMCNSERCHLTFHTECQFLCGKNCGHAKCGRVEENELLVLDDGVSWVITGQMKQVDGFVEKIMVKKRSVSVERSALYRMNEWGGMTEMGCEAEWRREGLIKAMKEKLIVTFHDSEELFVKVIDYLDTYDD